MSDTSRGGRCNLTHVLVFVLPASCVSAANAERRTPDEVIRLVSSIDLYFAPLSTSIIDGMGTKVLYDSSSLMSQLYACRRATNHITVLPRSLVVLRLTRPYSDCQAALCSQYDVTWCSLSSYVIILEQSAHAIDPLIIA
jgi:hypothetical protein